jgi:FtsH-binding integral membrane protein
MRNSTYKMRLGTAVLLGILLAAGVTFGQGNQVPGIPSFNQKSPGKAFGLSLVGTALPVVTSAAILAFVSSDSGTDFGTGIALLFTSMGTAIIGPAPGYFYGGLFGRGLLGMGIRAAGVAIIFSSFIPESMLLFGTGLAVVVGSTIWDLVKIKSAVNKRNERKRAVSLNISPVYVPQSKTCCISFQTQF